MNDSVFHITSILWSKWKAETSCPQIKITQSHMSILWFKLSCTCICSQIHTFPLKFNENSSTYSNCASLELVELFLFQSLRNNICYQWTRKWESYQPEYFSTLFQEMYKLFHLKYHEKYHKTKKIRCVTSILFTTFAFYSFKVFDRIEYNRIIRCVLVLSEDSNRYWFGVIEMLSVQR